MIDVLQEDALESGTGHGEVERRSTDVQHLTPGTLWFRCLPCGTKCLARLGALERWRQFVLPFPDADLVQASNVQHAQRTMVLIGVGFT